MGLDDRAADRQAHAHSVRFSRKQRVENPIEVLRADSSPAVRNRYHDAAAFVWLRFDAEHPWIFLGGHGVNGIGDQVDPDHNSMIPHTVVLEPGVRVYKIYNGYW